MASAFEGMDVEVLAEGRFLGQLVNATHLAFYIIYIYIYTFIYIFTFLVGGNVHHYFPKKTETTV